MSEKLELSRISYFSVWDHMREIVEGLFNEIDEQDEMIKDLEKRCANYQKTIKDHYIDMILEGETEGEC